MAKSQFTQEQIALACRDLAGQPADVVLRWAVETFYPRLTMATAFGPEGNCIIHMLAEIQPRVRIFNLETGYQFPETLELRERIKQKYGMEVEYVRADMSAQDYEQEHGGPLYIIRPDQCCLDRKIIPLRNAIVGYDAWISAIRKDQTPDRARADVVQCDAKFNLVKINPLLHWTKSDVWSFVTKHDIPYNPLHDRGYPSIGCWPCTAPVGEGEDERAGRWRGTERKSAACTSSSTTAAAASESSGNTLMRLSAKAQYACIAMVDLAGSHGDPNPVHLKQIADKHGISQRFLVQILLQLKGAGLVDSTRGATGGYLLARSPSAITLADIVHAIDQPPGPAPSALAGLYSTHVVQVVSAVLQEAQDREQRRFAEVTLEELVRQTQQRGEIVYQI